jgi:hypothetical protein
MPEHFVSGSDRAETPASKPLFLAPGIRANGNMEDFHYEWLLVYARQSEGLGGHVSATRLPLIDHVPASALHSIRILNTSKYSAQDVEKDQGTVRQQGVGVGPSPPSYIISIG